MLYIIFGMRFWYWWPRYCLPHWLHECFFNPVWVFICFSYQRTPQGPLITHWLELSCIVFHIRLKIRTSHYVNFWIVDYRWKVIRGSVLSLPATAFGCVLAADTYLITDCIINLINLLLNALKTSIKSHISRKLVKLIYV